MPPVGPMLAKSVSGVPKPGSVPGGLAYEPKWDGFRCIVFRDGDEVVLGSRNEKPLTRYFPDVVAAVRANLPPRSVVDAEIVVAIDGRLQFERLQDRIHPADSRVRMLAETTPATLVVFDLLALGDESLLAQPYSRRRQVLDAALADARPPVFVTPVTQDHGQALEWFDTFEGAGLDGIVCKPLAGAYEPDRRTMLKVKHDRTADCVVAGYRLHKTSTPERPLLGSLLLGLYDAEGGLAHVGVSASFSATRRSELYEELQPWATGVADHPWAQWQEWAIAEPGLAPGRRPGNVSRWNAGKDLSFVLLRPERVVEVAYDHMEGTRFRHTAQFRRWRPDRDPTSCTFAQLEEPVSYDLAAILTGA
jgi:ATP-dependent DNA ligase